jgi:EmrB/QacA subfamily drug resistance transporter
VVTAYLLTNTVSMPIYGKLSDLLGRKGIFQAAIVIFLIGSVLSGIAANMDELIAFRAIQGVGAGGLMALAMAIAGDVVSPRERGRYQGYFGAVFATASIAGPLVGGFFVDNLSWRWIFYINVPLGIVALAVTSAVLKLPFHRMQVRIDYLGSLLLVIGVSALLLVTVQTGTGLAGWGSPQIIGLLAGGGVSLFAFILWERRAPEPLLPPRLFRNDIFSVSGGLSFLLLMAMFGSMIYIPFYLQLVDGVSATESGLLLLPMITGMMITSITSGRLVSRTGRYKIYPIAGAIAVTVAMWLLTFLDANTPLVVLSLDLFLLGSGVGLVMQNTMMVVQNAVEPTDMGTATSAVTFFRSLGGVFGTALLGAVFVNRLNAWLPRLLPAKLSRNLPVHASASGLNVSPRQLRTFPSDVRHGIIGSFVHAIHGVYWMAVPFAALTVILALSLRQVDLRDTSAFSSLMTEMPFAIEDVDEIEDQAVQRLWINDRV